MIRSLRAAAALLLATACALVGAAAADAKTLDIVLLGDSYTAGSGGWAYEANTCARSANTWGQVYGRLAREQGLTVHVNNAACGGTVLSQLEAQMSAITPQTDLVLMSSGGNDAGFSDAVTRCFTPLVAGPNICRGALQASVRKLPAVETALEHNFHLLLAKLRPGARVGYISAPYLANSSGFLLRTPFAAYNSGAGTRAAQDGFDRVTHSAIAAANSTAGYEFVTFIPTKARFAGHEPDQNPWKEASGQWINEFTQVLGTTGYYHPNIKGYEEMGKAAMQVAGPAGDFGLSQ